MGSKLLLTGLALYLVDQGFYFPLATALAAIFAVMGIILIWLDK